MLITEGNNFKISFKGCHASFLVQQCWSRFFLNGVLHVFLFLREVAKPAILEQDPANHKINGGLRLHPSSSPQKMAALLHSFIVVMTLTLFLLLRT